MQKNPDCLLGPCTLLLNGNWQASLPGLNQLECEADH